MVCGVLAAAGLIGNRNQAGGHPRRPGSANPGAVVGVLALASGMRLALWFVLALPLLGSLAAIPDRILEAEFVAVVFVILNHLGLWGMVAALVLEPGPDVLLPRSAGLMLAGDVVKRVCLKIHGFGVRHTPRSAQGGLISAYLIGTLMLLLLDFMQ